MRRHAGHWLVALLPLCATPPLYAADLLQLTVVSGPPPAQAGRTYTTREATTMTVASGQTVALERTRGTDYQLDGAHAGWALTSVQQVPAEATAMEITPTVEGDQVSVSIAYRAHARDRSSAYSTTLRGALGEWLALLETNAGGDAGGVRVYRTGHAGEALSLRVERAP